MKFVYEVKQTKKYTRNTEYTEIYPPHDDRAMPLKELLPYVTR